MHFCNKELLEKIDSYISEHKSQIVSELAELVKIDSVRGTGSTYAPFGEGCKKVIEAVAELYESHGYSSKIEEHNNYVMSYFGNNGGKQLGIFSHADVVPVDGEWLITKPFEPIVKDGYMFGRGCNDDKSGIIQALYAAEIIKALSLPLKSELMMFAGANEESGMEDMDVFCQKERMPDVSLVPDANYPYFAGEKTICRFDIVSKNKTKTIKKFSGGTASNIVLGELSAELDFTEALWQEIKELCEDSSAFEISQNGEVIFIKAKGKSNHVANVHDSVNAAQLTAEMLIKCENISEEDKILLNDIVKFIDGGHGEGFNIEYSDEVFGALVCGNGIADITDGGKLKLNFDFRSSPFLDNDNAVAKISEAVSENWDLEVLRNSKGYLIDETGEIPNIIQNVYSFISGETDKKPVKTSGGTYSRVLKNSYSIGNIAGYKVTPISLPDGHGGFHQPDEKLSIDGFLEGIKILVCLIMEIDYLLNK